MFTKFERTRMFRQILSKRFHACLYSLFCIIKFYLIESRPWQCLFFMARCLEVLVVLALDRSNISNVLVGDFKDFQTLSHF